MRVRRPITEPIRTEANWDERWASHDQGMIASWERGREKRGEDSALASKAKAGELPVLPWKGGTDPTKKLKLTQKYGSMFYLAMWQGLRDEDLNIDTDEEPSLVCSATQIRVVFTWDISKLQVTEGS